MNVLFLKVNGGVETTTLLKQLDPILDNSDNQSL